jgi:hypothetical protein
VDKAGVIYNLPKSLGDKGGHLCAIEHLGLERPWHVMVEARSLHVIVSSDHPSADEQVAEAIARVVSRSVSRVLKADITLDAKLV